MAGLAWWSRLNPFVPAGHPGAIRFAPPVPAFWALPAPELASKLGAAVGGLTVAEANSRLAVYGANALRERADASAMRLLLRQFASPLLAILVVAALIAGAVGEWTASVIVVIIIAASGGLSFAQEYRASRAMEQLRNRVRVNAIAVRGGAAIEFAGDTIVPGDVVRLSAGSLVPADGVILDARDFFVSEAALTGEPLPVEKHPGVAPADATIAQRVNSAFMGTSVRSGVATVLIAATGRATEFGAIADRLRRRPAETDFERGIRRYGYLLTQVMLVVVIAVFAANLLLHRPPIDSLLFALALAVGMSPELLPAVISVTLAQGAREMARRGVIVRRLNAIENFGSMDILCTDKTGTLTRGMVGLDAAVDPAGKPSLPVLRLAALNASLQTGLANALDTAIVAGAAAASVETASATKIDEIPYDFARKRLSIVCSAGNSGNDRVLIAKGALDGILGVCDRVAKADGAALTLDAASRADVEKRFEEWSGHGYRVLGVAQKPVDAKPAYGIADEAGLIFCGFLLFLDPPKDRIKDTLAGLAGLGIRLKVITGDNRLVTAHLATLIGLPSTRVVTGAELRQVPDSALWRLAEDTDLFAEVDPDQKERIIVALQRSRHVVGFLGDGINDAPALHAADIGVSVDSAVDVAKEAADFVLVEHDLEVLRAGVEEGRATFANTLKYIFITTSANFGNMISMAVASLVLPFLPLLATQVLLNNFLSDLPALAIARDNVDPELIVRPRRWDLAAVRNFMIVFGAISSVFDFLTFGVLLWVFHAGEGLFQTGWFVESLMTELAVALVIRTNRPFYRSRPGRPLLWLTLAVMVLTIALPYTPFATFFGFIVLPLPVLGAVLGIVVLYLLATEVAKDFVYRRM